MTHQPNDRAYVVEVNEGVLEASRMGVDWWYARRPMFVMSGRLRETVPAGLIAGRVEISCDTEDDAQFMATHMVEVGGLPQSAVKVKRVSAAVAA